MKEDENDLMNVRLPLIVTAVIELATGVALLIIPSQTAELPLGVLQECFDLMRRHEIFMQNVRPVSILLLVDFDALVHQLIARDELLSG